MKKLRTILKFTVTGTIVGLVIGGVFYPVSGDIFVILFVGSLVTLVGFVLGIVHRNDP